MMQCEWHGSAAKAARTLALAALMGLVSCGGGGGNTTGSSTVPDTSSDSPPSIPPSSSPPSSGNQVLPVIQLQAESITIGAEVADEAWEREQGLMYRTAVGQNEGMIFVFSEPVTICLWMKNTYVPLSAAFIDEDGTIVNIEDMQPQSEYLHCSARPLRHALEMNQGWFGVNNIQPGSKISGLP